MSDFALYRLPNATTYTELRQERGGAGRLNSLSDLNGREGFVIAPFAPSDDCPILLLRPDAVMEHAPYDGERLYCCSQRRGDEVERAKYEGDFAKFKARIDTGEFNKIVLSRCAHIEAGLGIHAKSLFLRACEFYPHVFVALVSTEASGTWLIASPEILLEGDGEKWRSIALAGTMRYAENAQWTDKNKAEQGYVRRYIGETLAPFVENMVETELYTVRAGNLVHLRSDFDFSVKDASRLGDLLSALHPTPAVCGLPKAEAYRFILENESCPRGYYSGFMGMLRPSGDTHLYVSLRCMRITANGFDLFAGGGLIEGSDERREWEETEAKMDMMRGIIE